MFDLSFKSHIKREKGNRFLPEKIIQRVNIKGFIVFCWLRNAEVFDLAAARWRGELKNCKCRFSSLFWVVFFFLSFLCICLSLAMIFVPLWWFCSSPSNRSEWNFLFILNCVLLFHPTRVGIDDWKIGVSRSTPIGHANKKRVIKRADLRGWIKLFHYRPETHFFFFFLFTHRSAWANFRLIFHFFFSLHRQFFSFVIYCTVIVTVDPIFCLVLF